MNTCLAVLGSGPGSEVENVCRHFRGPLGAALAIDALDWASQAKPCVAFRQLDLRGNKEEVLGLLNDEAVFPLDTRLLIVASSVASDMFFASGADGGLLAAYLSELPPHADLLILEPFSAMVAPAPAATAVTNAAPGALLESWGRAAAAAAGWPGFVYLGGPRHRSLFFSRHEAPLVGCGGGGAI